MKKEVWRGQNSARFIYFRYKDSPYFSVLILAIIFLVCIVLIFQIIIPTSQKWFSIRDEAEAVRKQIGILKGNVSFMSVLNKQALEDKRLLAIRALPVEKDFGEIINAIELTAIETGVSIDDFNFNLGLVSSNSAGSKGKFGDDTLDTKLTLYLDGNLNAVQSFIKEIGEKLPINHIESISMSSDSSTISLFFHSKPYKSLQISEDEPINALTSENNAVFSKLSQWNAASSYDGIMQIQASSAGVPLF